MKGVAWDGVGAPQLESAKKAGELLSEVSLFVQRWKREDKSFVSRGVQEGRSQTVHSVSFISL